MIEFKRKDFLYNNGLVNIFLTLNEHADKKNRLRDFPYKILWKGVHIILTHDLLIFDCEEEKLFEVYNFLIREYYKNVLEDEEYIENKKVYITEENEPIIKPTIQVKRLFFRTERMKDLQKKYLGIKYVSKNEYKDILEKIRQFKERYPEKFKRVKDKIRQGEEKEKEEKIPVFVYRKKEKIIDILSQKNISEGEPCTLCGSIYTKDGGKQLVISSINLVYDFGEAPPVNRDHRIKASLPICFMCDLIYKYGLLRNFFWNNTVFVFDLRSLGLMAYVKVKLDISNSYKHRKDSIKTNISEKNTFYIYNNACPKLLELLWNIYFKKLSGEIRGDVLNDLSGGQIIMFDITNEGVENSIFYNNLSYIFKFFEMLDNQNLKEFFRSLTGYYYLKDKDKVGVLQNELTSSILFKREIERCMLETSYIHFSTFDKKKKNTKTLNRDKLYLFLKEYNKLIKGDIMEEKDERILKLCASLGERIGHFAAETDNKSLLYSLREIGNKERLIEFFREFEYEILKEDKGEILNAQENKRGINKKYSEIIEEILNLSLNRNLINSIRDLIGIFAVQNYLSTKYAKSRGDKNDKQ